MKLLSVLAGSTGLAVSFASGFVAEAQESFFDRDRYTSVTERAQPEFDPEPVRIGAFALRPEAIFGFETRSNLFAASSNEISDVGLIAAPTIRGRTTWSRHELNFSANIQHTEYADTDSESNTNFGANIGGRLDASSDLTLTGQVTATQTNEPRSAAASIPAAAEPIQVNRLGAQIGTQYQAGRIQISANAAMDQFDFQDADLVTGGILDQDFRDHDQIDLRARAAWAVNRDLALFVEAGHIDRDYDAPTVLAPLNRDSQGRVIRVGANFELPVLLRGDVAIGHQSFDFDDPNLSEVEGLSVDARVQWFVSQLVTLTASGSRSVEDPGLFAVAGSEVTNWTIRGDYEARRNLLLFAEAGVSNYDYEDIDRSDDRVVAAVGATYKLNKRAWLETSLRHINQDSDFQDFSDNRLQLALKLYP